MASAGWVAIGAAVGGGGVDVAGIALGGAVGAGEVAEGATVDVAVGVEGPQAAMIVHTVKRLRNRIALDMGGASLVQLYINGGSNAPMEVAARDIVLGRLSSRAWNGESGEGTERLVA